MSTFRMEDEDNGFSVTIEYDGEGWPTVHISTGDGFVDENDRPAVEVTLNGATIHTMFANEPQQLGDLLDEAVDDLVEHATEAGHPPPPGWNDPFDAFDEPEGWDGSQPLT